LSGLRTSHMKEIAIIPFSNLPELLPALRRMPDLEQLTLERPSIISETNEVSLDGVPLARLDSREYTAGLASLILSKLL
jgi:hypothetical protein